MSILPTSGVADGGAVSTPGQPEAAQVPLQGRWTRGRGGLRNLWRTSQLFLIFAVTGAAAGVTFISWGPIFVPASNSGLLTCGFEEGPFWNLVGSGVPSSTTYISTTGLNAYQSTPLPSVSVVARAYGGGSGTEEYLVGEISFFCTALPSGSTTVTLSVQDTTPLGATATYGVTFIQTGASSSTDPTTTSACDGTSPNYLYEPSGGGSIWAWDSQSGGLLGSSGGCPVAFSTGAISLALTTASTTSPVFTFSFGFVGMPVSTCSSSCTSYTTYTLSFTAHNP